MFTDIEIHRAAKLYVPQCRRSAVAGARSSLYRGLDSMREPEVGKSPRSSFCVVIQKLDMLLEARDQSAAADVPLCVVIGP